ncbi:hypothetical protein Zmor_008524 [Zophobas morio]|uniref:Odorant receptor n=1 Tax=Zophobas morio TaxID=2755281 RepID=A0AA38J352_9CUCU|nr:hypothetical protein Zmor_008524 [Zophobas morio]
MNTVKNFFQKINPYQDDSVWLVRILYVDIYLSKFMKICRMAVIAYTLVMTTLQTFLFLQKFDGIYFIKYLALYAGSVVILVATFAVPYVYRSVAVVINCLDSWPVVYITNKMKKTIKVESFFVNGFVFLNTLLALFSASLYFVPVDGDDDIFFVFRLCEELFPRWKNLLSWFYRILFLPVAVLMPSVLYLTLYCMTRLRFQFYLLIHLLKVVNESDKEKVDKSVLLYGQQHQEEITRKLKFCIKRHNEIYEITYTASKKIDTFIFIFSIASAIFGTSIVVFYFSFQGSVEGIRYLGVAALVIVAVAMVVSIFLCGQSIENVSNELVEVLQQMDWNYWNRENKFLYLMFLSHAQQTLQIKFSNSVALNYELGVSIGKFIYSMLSVMSQIKDIDYGSYYKM